MMDWIFWLKLLHTAVVIVVYACMVYIIYCGIFNKQNHILRVSFAVVIFISLAYVINGECIITTWVRDISGRSDVSDIFLPDWIARKIVPVSIVMLSAGTILHAKNYLIQYKITRLVKKNEQ